MPPLPPVQMSGCMARQLASSVSCGRRRSQGCAVGTKLRIHSRQLHSHPPNKPAVIFCSSPQAVCCSQAGRCQASNSTCGGQAAVQPPAHPMRGHNSLPGCASPACACPRPQIKPALGLPAPAARSAVRHSARRPRRPRLRPPRRRWLRAGRSGWCPAGSAASPRPWSCRRRSRLAGDRGVRKRSDPGNQPTLLLLTSLSSWPGPASQLVCCDAPFPPH